MSGRISNEQWAFNQRQAEAYRGYLITPTIGGEFTVSKDRARICYAKSKDHAKQLIDEVIGSDSITDDWLRQS